MKFFIIFAAIVGCVFGATNYVLPATTLVRSPSDDSAYIQSDRLGGNFAYSTYEGQAYKAYSPIVQNIVRPVAVSYQAPYYPYAHYPYAYAPAAGLPLAYVAPKLA